MTKRPKNVPTDASIEAECKKCKERFMPDSEKKADLVHNVRANGDPCGGRGKIKGWWFAWDGSKKF